MSIIGMFLSTESAVIETFENRGTAMTLDSAAFCDEFIQDKLHQTRWKSFLKKKKTLIQVTMDDALSGMKKFVKPIPEGNSGGKTPATRKRDVGNKLIPNTSAVPAAADRKNDLPAQIVFSRSLVMKMFNL